MRKVFIICFTLACITMGALSAVRFGNQKEEIILQGEEEVVSQEVTTTPAPSALVSSIPLNLSASKIWNLTNTTRVQNGVNPLKEETNLCNFAEDAAEKIYELKRPLHESESKPIATANGVLRYHIAQSAGYLPENNIIDIFNKDERSKLMMIGGEYVWGCAKAKSYAVILVATY